jgi:hypothetical protein
MILLALPGKVTQYNGIIMNGKDAEYAFLLLGAVYQEGN